MKRAVIVEIVRTPFAKAREGGALEGIHPVDLLATCLEAIVDPSGIQSNLIDDVIVGCSLPAAEQSGNIARNAVLAADILRMSPQSLSIVNAVHSNKRYTLQHKE
ncbi:3-ketoacyl-CoA thiolase [Acidithrix ferrooxidans]|uniref:3-ketoacyl-CoA thiolase n=1 Tax=Acidithrix ferrooxidans TaxID=1280514 RepID=A0A0D8HD83_9ACTN|nr:hypothetical protein [Acidithrix ferrooxidans]KJF15878.1 3-ketoacyl-CoA thiolase [Acidithrix ferrooxidans]CAG4906500.1 unnamed protein product [Acidithrix sp. C25]